MSVQIRPMESQDIEAVARVHASEFPRQLDSSLWVGANFEAFPRIQYFVAAEDGEVLGFIAWMERAGFRKDAVLELEQIAVVAARQGEGIGRRLITESLTAVSRRLVERGSRLKSVLVSTRTDNEAQRLYADVLGADGVAVIPDLYSADELLMLARDPLAHV